MNRFSKLSEKLVGLTAAVTRYPVAAAFLLLATAVNAYTLIADKNYENAWMACIVGAALSVVLQAAHEHFGKKPFARWLLSAAGIIAAGVYYLLIRAEPAYSTENTARTTVLMFALMFAYMLMPAIKSRISFNESFMAVFKALFQSFFYAAVFFIGCSLIIAAFDTLISPVGSDAYLHMANVVFVLLAPVLLLSLIPVYPGRRSPGKGTAPEGFLHEEAIARAVYCPKFLEILISYIIIPLAAIFTVILVLYIFLNIGGDFWRNNLLEPLLISYAISIMLILFLAARLSNRVAVLFCKIFPKVLVPVVVFQLIASTFILRDTGVTHARYFVIIFGIFAACAGVLLSIDPLRRSGSAAALLITFSIVAVTPPVDAFTVSRVSQRQRLETVLNQNDMLQNNTLIPAADISEADEEAIASSLEYLYRMNAIGKLAWLPAQFDYYADFENAFGFSRYGTPGKTGRYIYVQAPSGLPADIAGYEILTTASVNANVSVNATICEFDKGGNTYILLETSRGGRAHLILSEKGGEELISFDTDEIFARYSEFDDEPLPLSAQQAIFAVENDRAKLMLFIQHATVNTDSANYNRADFYVMMAVK